MNDENKIETLICDVIHNIVIAYDGWTNQYVFKEKDKPFITIDMVENNINCKEDVFKFYFKHLKKLGYC